MRVLLATPNGNRAIRRYRFAGNRPAGVHFVTESIGAFAERLPLELYRRHIAMPDAVRDLAYSAKRLLLRLKPGNQGPATQASSPMTSP